MMNILSSLHDHEVWMDFCAKKAAGGHTGKRELHALEKFIETQAYLPYADIAQAGQCFSPPKKVAISKMGSDKKRIVYIFPVQERTVLKLITYLMQRKYDQLFAPNLYSFRPGVGVRNAVDHLRKIPGIFQMWAYKVDIRDYFNSIPVERMIATLQQKLPDEPELIRFLAGLLKNPTVLLDDAPIVDTAKGIMAGTPISTFLANLYLSELDWEFYKSGIPYARYSDDIIVFAPSEDRLEEAICRIRSFLDQCGLTVNPKKENRFSPAEPWIFLGFQLSNDRIDVAPVSIEKLKAKMRRKTRALKRWADKKGLPGTHAAKAFIRTFNRKLFENPIDHELTWARWYFPMLTTADSLRQIDQYAQDCIRYLATGTRTKAAYNFRYADMKQLGYVSLVNRYYGQWQNPSDSEETVD